MKQIESNEYPQIGRNKIVLVYDGIYSVPFMSKVMIRDSFENILSSLHFANNAEQLSRRPIIPLSLKNTTSNKSFQLSIWKNFDPRQILMAYGKI